MAAGKDLLTGPGGASRGCLCPGSFDPVTSGHLDIIRRARDLFGEVYAGVLDSAAKQYMFSSGQRLQMLREACSGLTGVHVVRWEGLTVDLLSALGVNVVVRGVRSMQDFDAETQIAAVNRKLRPGTETVLLAASPEWRSVSSTIVRELIRFGADITGFVPDNVLYQLQSSGDVDEGKTKQGGSAGADRRLQLHEDL